MNAVTKMSFSGSPFQNLWYILKYMEFQLNKKKLDYNISANAQQSSTLPLKDKAVAGLTNY